MKLAPLLLFPFLIAGSAQAYESQPGWSSSRKCIRKEYREEYVPGTANRPGYVKSISYTHLTLPTILLE